MNNTYVEKGYKYGVIAFPDLCTGELKKVLESTKEESNINLPRKREIEGTFTIPTNNILDFDNISGLTIKDIKDYKELLFAGRYLIFVMYDSITVQNPTPKKDDNKVLDIAKIRYISSLDMNKYLDMPINDLLGNILVGNELLSKNSYLNETNKKRALSFLEKYVYDDKEHAYNAAFYKIKK